MTQSRNVVSAALVVLINGRIIGEVTALSCSMMTPAQESFGVDQLLPFELIPGQARLTGTMGVLRRQNSGGLEGRGIAAPAQNLAEQRYFSLLVVNRKDQTTILRADQCMVQQQQWEATARGRVSGSFSFSGMVWANEIASQVLIG